MFQWEEREKDYLEKRFVKKIKCMFFIKMHQCRIKELLLHTEGDESGYKGLPVM